MFVIFAILALTWPWCKHFSGEFLEHWDPPFHAWKLELMANRILSGDIFMSNADTNLLYPHSGTLYFEALHWPAALLAALFFSITSWPSEFVYHVVLILFWALSAPFMWWFLKDLKLGNAAAFTGAVVFCLLPYRISYATEFQMQLAFGVPLCYMLTLRMLRNHRIRDGIFLACSWWLLAVTELYQAVFILFTLPFIGLAHFAVFPQDLRKRNFWKATIAALITGVASLPVMLWNYLAQKSEGSSMRSLNEVIVHSIQPLSYLKPFGRFHLWDITAKTEELCGYPTLAVMILSLLALMLWLSKLHNSTVSTPRWRRIAPLPALLTLLAFMVLTFVFKAGVGAESHFLVSLWKGLPLVSMIFCVLLCFAPGQSALIRFLIGMSAAAVLCYYLSVGPRLTLAGTEVDTSNKLYLALYRHTHILSGFRAACRFGVFVLFFMVCAAAAGLNDVIGRARAKCRSWKCAWLVSAVISGFVILAVCVEAIPPLSFIRFRPVERLADYPVTRRIKARGKDRVIAMFPMGSKNLDGMMMFSLLRDDTLSFYAWGGYFPPFALEVKRAVDRGEMELACRNLAMIWPPCEVLVDRMRMIRPRNNFASEFPNYVKRSRKGAYVEMAAMFSKYAKVIDSDKRFTLMSFLPFPASTNAVKIFRSDFVRRAPIAQAKLVGAPDAKINILFNEERMASLQLDSKGSALWHGDLSEMELEPALYNRLEFSSNSKFLLVNFRLSEGQQ